MDVLENLSRALRGSAHVQNIQGRLECAERDFLRAVFAVLVSSTQNTSDSNTIVVKLSRIERGQHIRSYAFAYASDRCRSAHSIAQTMRVVRS